MKVPEAGPFAAFDQAGRDRRQYELVTAMAEALEDPGCRERFERGEPAFRRPLTIPGTRGIRVRIRRR